MFAQIHNFSFQTRTLTMTFINYFILFTSIAVPLLLLLRRKHEWLVFWIAFTVMIEIFNSLTFVSITATKAAGLLLIPYLIKNASDLLSTKPGKLLAVLTLLLLSLGVIYGFVAPWPDTTGVRPLRQMSQGRSVLYFGSYFLELSVIVFLATQMKNRGTFRFLFLGIVFGGVASGIGMLLERIFHFDFFYYFTGWDPRPLSIRQRGFNYEPRGAAYSAVVGLLALMTPTDKLNTRARSICLLLVYSGFYLAASVSGLFLLLGSLAILVTFNFIIRHNFQYEWRLLLRNIATLAIVMFVFHGPAKIFHLLDGGQQSAWEYNIQSKKDVYIPRTGGLPQLEIFDAAAVAFFADHPTYLALGTGPGLMSLASSPYYPLGRIDSLPHIGFLLQISNYGLIGFGLWLAMCSLLALTMLSRRYLLSGPNENRVKFSMFVMLLALYVIQAKIFYMVALGIGFSVYLANREENLAKAL